MPPCPLLGGVFDDKQTPAVDNPKEVVVAVGHIISTHAFVVVFPVCDVKQAIHVFGTTTNENENEDNLLRLLP